ncbi:tRNA lysidine(34) synthetase TilS [Luteolibacter flavescens]|uniref:tRNA(Ile)-lysidine synthase n=1 Tax=Luteolibacter flavescens TaxID=1859460 RepID=A0ABT3FKM7_9BACT|nr:tRNA lysidine(34) synthetase TilS [Luteolibacter flavescens]MCW1884133.1 tRNA lysidine(34) synthetase TilS [Luteolibacter flavescens]
MPVPEIPWFQSASRRRRYLAGISGGADSVALLHLLHRAGFRDVVVCHLDHGLRGQASAGDARFVEKLAASLGYPCESGKADVQAMIRETGDSLETAARDARHAFFAACSRKHRCPRLLLAHHADDQAETILWNLLRGSRGLSGMRAEQVLQMDGKPVECLRPLLTMRRDELLAWLVSEKIAWREDASNAEPIAARNRLRNEALPLLSDIARRDITALLNRAADSSDELRVIERWAVEQAAALDPQGRLHVPRLRTLPREVQSACLYDYLRTSGVPELSRDLVARGLTLLDADGPPAVNLPGDRVLRRRAGRIFIV